MASCSLISTLVGSSCGISRYSTQRKLSVILSSCKKNIKGHLNTLNTHDPPNTHIVKQVYHSIIYSFLTYAVIVWGNTYKTNIQPLVVLHKKLYDSLHFRTIRRIHLLFLKILIIKIRTQHITFSKAIKAISVRF